MYQELKQNLKRVPLVMKVYRSFNYLKARPVKVEYLYKIENLELTNKCPMKCVMCVRTYEMTRSQGFMGFDLFKKMIDEITVLDAPFIHEEGFWLHHFGESLLHPEFDKMVRYCSDKGVKVGLSVNPIAMGKEIARKLIDAKPNLLFIALDGHDDESFYKIRGVPKAYERSKENLKHFLEIKNGSGSKIKTVLSMIDFPENKDSIKKMANYWKKMKGVDEVHIKPFTTWNGDADKINNLDPARKKSVVSPPTEGKKCGRIKCNIPWESMSVTWDGYAVPCCYDYNKKYVLGNVNENSLSDIWNGEKMQELRKEFISGQVTNSLCAKCPALYQ